MVEATAQVGGIILALAAAQPGSTDSVSGDLGAPPELVGVLATVRRFAFKRIVVPGDSLLIAARIGARVGGLIEVSAELRVENTVVATGSVAIAVSRSGPLQ
jgi:3-hydroxyacyl-[acyl-carrier-protein] dehydratase